MTVAAIFDLDGTLVTFNLDMSEWRKALLGLMEKRGFRTKGLGVTTPTQQILDAAKSQVASERPEKFDGLRREAFSVLDSMELRGASSATVFPGAVEALRRLKAEGVRLCVVTNSGRAAASRTLEKWGLNGFFEFVLTRDDTETMKPRPEGLLKAMKMLGVGPGGVYYVGDSRYDIMAAKQAGVKVVSVATGSYTPDRLRSEGADFVIEDLSELPGLLGN